MNLLIVDNAIFSILESPSPSRFEILAKPPRPPVHVFVSRNHRRSAAVRRLRIRVGFQLIFMIKINN
jgi:hypothetical protein